MVSAAKQFSVLVVVTALGIAQAAQRAQFDVASVKVHASDDQRTYMVAQPGAQTGVGSLTTLRGMPLNQFTPFLSSFVNRVVVDRTGLDGRYDIELKWTPDQPAQGRGGAGEAIDPDAISIFTAVQEQLGLQLNPTRETVDVLVIDTLEHPTPN